MSRLIDADALMELVEKTHCTGCNSYNKVRCRACPTGDMLDYLDQAPTVNEWHYPSKGEYPKEGENLLCLVSENFDDYRIGHLGTDRLWWTNDGVEDDIACWQYIVPPKEEA